MRFSSLEKVKQGKIRGWGCCNESPYGATRLVATAKAMNATPPCAWTCFLRRPREF